MLKRVLKPNDNVPLNRINIRSHVNPSIGHQYSINTIENILPKIHRKYNQTVHPITAKHVLETIDCHPSPWWFEEWHQCNRDDYRTCHPRDIDTSFSDHDNPEQVD